MDTTVNESHNESVIIVENLTKIYGREINLGVKEIGRKVVGAKNVSFKIKKGEIFGFLGPNGAGKTTTMRSMLNYLNIQEGHVTYFGNLDHKSDSLLIRERLAYVPGDVALYGNYKGLELIEFFGKFRPIDYEFLEELKRVFRVDLSLKIKNLSKGNRQQVALIAAMASKPDLLIFDEPSSGLDPLMVVKLHNILRKLRDQGITIFLSSHDLTEVQAICDRVGIIRDGEMIIIEAVEDLRQKSLQNMTIEFYKDKAKPSEEDFMKLSTVISVMEKRNGHNHNGTIIYILKIKENVNELIKFLGQYDIKRLSIENASLSDIFLTYYWGGLVNNVNHL